MDGLISIVISFIALAIAMVTAWLTWFREGELCMTQPTVVFFGPDGHSDTNHPRPLKVFLRTLLYSTAKRGQVIESLHVTLQRAESRQNFSIWVYGDEHMARGSGLFVPQEGVACNHHFLLPDDGSDFQLLAGKYTLRVIAKKARSSSIQELSSIQLHISKEHSRDLCDANTGIYFDWSPDQQAYYPHTEKRRYNPVPGFILKGAKGIDATTNPAERE